MVITYSYIFYFNLSNNLIGFLYLLNNKQPSLYNRKGVRKVVRLGDRLVDWNAQFRIFMFSSVGIPITSPQASALVNTINFNTTEASLTEQVGNTFLHVFL